VFAAVMAAGILSIAASKHHYAEISEFLGSLAAVGLVGLIARVSLTGAAKRWDLTDPDVTTPRAVVVTLPCASAAVLAGADWAHRSRYDGPRVVGVKVAQRTSERWLLAVAVPVWVAALCIYGLMTWLILWRTVAKRQGRDGFEPDTWILMGGLAIATLAGDNIHGLAPAWLGRPVLAVTVVTWVVATLWMPPLVYFGLRRISRGPERLHFAGVWWAFVFPLGMYSAATYAMATELSQRSLITVSLVFFWDALAAWLIVVGAGLLRAGLPWRV
jgi:tellurite resistance protein TehA-like permease